MAASVAMHILKEPDVLKNWSRCLPEGKTTINESYSLKWRGTLYAVPCPHTTEGSKIDDYCIFSIERHLRLFKSAFWSRRLLMRYNFVGIFKVDLSSCTV